MTLAEGCVAECRGCFHRGIGLEESLEQKTTWLKKVFSPWSEKIKNFVFLPWEMQAGYRDKVCLDAMYDENRWKFGLRHKGQIIPIHDCPVHSERIRKTIRIFCKYLPGQDQLPLTSYIQSGAQVVMVVKSDNIQGIQWKDTFFRELVDAGNDGVWLQLNPDAGEKTYYRVQWQFLYGKQRSLNEFRLFYGPVSFQQLIPRFFYEFLNITLNFYDFQEGDGIADLYCGTGNTLAAWVRQGVKAIGVEINNEAVECARMNVANTLVLRGKCSERLDHINEWVEYKSIKRFLLFANPPKTGLEPIILRWITEKSRPQKMAYLSCNVRTQRADLDCLISAGYEVVAIHPFDAYPRTHHVECLLLLERGVV